MMTLSDDGEKTCPLCLEEMDLTDQQLKPCKCGYEICLLCWHQLNELAEKERLEGRCPACRKPYDKERIVKMAANCERVVADINATKKQKSQKAKPKATADAKKQHLSSVRVIQKNLVYIIGLPSNLCDESILERKEYFGQYGKVLKVSISRPSGATSQQTLNNNTFSVYITYAKEEEAARCIQGVHNYVLDGKPLRACFGTTKYCHAWLKNTSCNNPDCLYLHDIGSQEDSFTKDEIISAYTRTRVTQIGSNSSLRRGGNNFPPSVDDLNGASKIHAKSILNSTSTKVQGSPPNSSTGKSTMLPAAASWGVRGANCQPAAGLAASLISSVKHKIDTNGHSSMSSSLAESTKQSSAWNDEVYSAAPRVSLSRTSTVSSSPMADLSSECSKQSSAWHDEVFTKSKLTEGRNGVSFAGHSVISTKLASGKDGPLNGSPKASLESDYDSGTSAWNDEAVVRSNIEIFVPPLDSRTRQAELLRPATEKRVGLPLYDNNVDSLDISCNLETSSSSVNDPISNSEDRERGTSVETDDKAQVLNPASKDINQQSSELCSDHVSVTGTKVSTQGLCLGLSSLKADSRDWADLSDAQLTLASTLCSSDMPKQHSDPAVVPLSKGSLMLDEEHIGKDHCRRPLNSEQTPEIYGMGELPLHFDSQRSRHLDSNNALPSLGCVIDLNNTNSITNFSKGANGYNELLLADQNMNRMLSWPRESENALSTGNIVEEFDSFSETRNTVECTELSSTLGKVDLLGRVDYIANHNKAASVDIMGESSIISDILSLDFNPWDDSLFAADNFASLFGENDKQERSINLSNSLKSPSSSQSRFSFAQQEIQTHDVEPPVNEKIHLQTYFSRDDYNDEFRFVPPFNALENTFNATSCDRVISSDMSAGMPKAKLAAPPGFSAPIRAPPPGFSAQDRLNHTYEAAYSENRSLGSSSAGNHYQSHLSGNLCDVELIDPAILAVGKGLMPPAINNPGLGFKSTFPSQFSPSGIDPRFHVFMQQNTSPHNVRIPDIGDRFMPLNDAYITSQLLSQNHGNISPFAHLAVQQQRNSHFTNSHRNSWNDLRSGSDIGINEIMRNEIFGLNSYYSGNEEHTFHMPNNDMYYRAFGM